MVKTLPFQPSPYESNMLIVASDGNSKHPSNGAFPSATTPPSQSLIDHDTSSCQSPPATVTTVASQSDGSSSQAPSV